MKTHTVGEQTYYSFDELNEKYPAMFDIANTGEKLIKCEKLVEGKDFIYGILDSNDKYIRCNCKTNKVLLLSKWVDENTELKEAEEYDLNHNESDEEVSDEEVLEIKRSKKSKHPLYLPNDLVLDKNECFYDDDDNIIEIHVVGKKKSDEMYLNLKDVENGFKIKGLRRIILKNEEDIYEEDVDYVVFQISKTDTRTVMYLTYMGLIKVLVLNRSASALNFMRKAKKDVFTCHLGSKKDKEELGHKMISEMNKKETEEAEKVLIQARNEQARRRMNNPKYHESTRRKRNKKLAKKK